ncbi:MAG: DUF465 domain-containing protein [Alphaproteobacteria bacterium]|nr:DUF465 domain-containing protein [Alphaproteobacteria bacterium]
MEQKSIDALRSEHRRIDDAIQHEYANHDPDDARIAELKRLKLRIKDQIVSVAGSA